jgi:biotin carboxyl carrier protein
VSKYVALLDGGTREETVEVRQLGPGQYEVRVGEGRKHVVDAFQHDFGTVSLIVDTQSWSVQLDRGETAMKVHVRDAVFPLEILDERRLRMRRAAGRFTPHGRQTVVAPLPGRVVEVLATVGQPVRQGQGLLVVHALEMDNVMRSPKDGRVVELHVAEGQAVEGGARLAAVE